MAKAAGAADTMQVRLWELGEVKVDDYIDSLDVNSSGAKIWNINKKNNNKISLKGQYHHNQQGMESECSF